MTQEELNQIIDSDGYFKNRKEPSPTERIWYLREVNFHCPLCGKELKSRFQKKPEKNLYEIAHIFPNRPTLMQYPVLQSLPRLGDNSESFENKIVLCKDCHDLQDYHTTKKDYLKLYEIKKHLLEEEKLREATNSLGFEDALKELVNKLMAFSDEEIEIERQRLNYSPVELARKFTSSEGLLKREIQGHVTEFYPIIRDYFREICSGKESSFDGVSHLIKGCFEKMWEKSQDKNLIFQEMSQWLSNQTQAGDINACYIVISYFVQQCEVFHEITQ